MAFEELMAEAMSKKGKDDKKKKKESKHEHEHDHAHGDAYEQDCFPDEKKEKT